MDRVKEFSDFGIRYMSLFAITKANVFIMPDPKIIIDANIKNSNSSIKVLLITLSGEVLRQFNSTQ